MKAPAPRPDGGSGELLRITDLWWFAREATGVQIGEGSLEAKRYGRVREWGARRTCLLVGEWNAVLVPALGRISAHLGEHRREVAHGHPAS